MFIYVYYLFCKSIACSFCPGVGVDIRVHRSIIFGLSSNTEDLLQEGGRCMRGGVDETMGERGFSFFLHKGALGK